MARPTKDSDAKAVRISSSISPDLMKRVEHYCQKEERSIAWVIKKSLEEFFEKRGE